MKQKILDIISQKPKRFTFIIARDASLLDWVMNNSIIDPASPLVQHVYSALHNSTNVCPHGGVKGLRNITLGWSTGCGPAGKCKCTRAAVSASVSANKQARSKEDIKAENKKREATNLKTHGVKNTGQTKQAKANHAAFYADPTSAAAAVVKQQATMTLLYGQDNPMKVTQFKDAAIATSIQRYGVANPMQNSTISALSATNRSINFNSSESIKKNFPSFVEMLKSSYNVEPLMTADEYIGVGTRPFINFKCCDCGHTFVKRMDYNETTAPYCKVCNPSEKSFCSKEEQSVAEFIKEHYTGKMVIGDRSVINPFQLDIYLPDLNLAIEYCGLYWHSENGGASKKFSYHRIKYELAASKGIRLITLYSDEWLQKQDIVKDKLLAIIGVTKLANIGARQCTVAKVERGVARAFYDAHHIQGSSMTIGDTYGLHHNGELVAAMSFKRIDVANNVYELSRFATRLNVRGGASKLLKHFITVSDANSIVSFADLRWSTGDMYYKLGFTNVGEVPPMQYYVENYTTRYHKLKFKNIVNEGEDITEWGKLQSLGYDRIWDCGKIKFALDISRDI
jgi:hypothetical protein